MVREGLWGSCLGNGSDDCIADVVLECCVVVLLFAVLVVRVLLRGFSGSVWEVLLFVVVSLVGILLGGLVW